MNVNADCEICAYERNGVPLGWLYQDPFWSVGIYPSFHVPGWVVLQSRRHAEGIVQLNTDELTTFGPTLAAVARAVYTATNAERVYILSYSDRRKHVHVLLQGRGADVPPEHWGPGFLVNEKRYRDPSRQTEMADRIRHELTNGLVRD